MEYSQQRLAETSDRILGLELIRFFCALGVLVWHYQHFVDKATNFIREQQPFYSVLSVLYNNGQYGVQIFWCASGYILYWKYGAAISEKMISGWKFFILRFSRIYPLHIATLLLVAFLQFLYFSHNNYYFIYKNNGYAQFVLQLFLANNWSYQRMFSFNGPIWSVSVEVPIYFFFFVALRFVGISMTFILGIIAACAVVKSQGISVEIVNCLGYFYAGGLSAVLTERCERARYKWLWRGLALLITFGGLFVFGMSEISKIPHIKLLGMIYMPIFLYCFSFCISANSRISALIQMAGNIAYSSYLIQFPAQLATALLFSYADSPIPFYSRMFFIAYIATTLLLSCWIYRFFERPAQTAIRARLV